jgi:hypothetical protein
MLSEAIFDVIFRPSTQLESFKPWRAAATSCGLPQRRNRAGAVRASYSSPLKMAGHHAAGANGAILSPGTIAIHTTFG